MGHKIFKEAILTTFVKRNIGKDQRNRAEGTIKIREPPPPKKKTKKQEKILDELPPKSINYLLRILQVLCFLYNT